MVDFLKAYPFMSMDDYLWKYSSPMIKIMGMDSSHVNYLSENEAKNRQGKIMNVGGQSVADLNNDLGVAIDFSR